MRRRVIQAVAVVGLLAVLGGVLTARLFVWPTRGFRAHADAIVLLDGTGDRFLLAFALAGQHVAPNLVVSTGKGLTRPFEGGGCAPAFPGVTVTCFSPHPASTRGEARFIGQLATRMHWSTIIIVTTRPQATRARWRVSRCWSGRIGVATAGLPRSQWPRAVTYEWAAMLKAEIFQRGC